MPDSGQDLIKAMRDQRLQLIDCVNAMKQTGRLLAQAEYEYKTSYRKEVFRLHEEDKTAWTSTTDLAKGDEAVAKKRFKRDCYKSDYQCFLEKLNCIKIEIRLLENEIREEKAM